MSVDANSILLNSGGPFDVFSSSVDFTVDVDGKVDAEIGLAFLDLDRRRANGSGISSLELSLSIVDKSNGNNQLFFDELDDAGLTDRNSSLFAFSGTDRADKFFTGNGASPNQWDPVKYPNAEALYENIVTDFNARVDIDYINPVNTAGDRVTTVTPLEDTDFSNDVPVVDTPPIIEGEAITAPAPKPRPEPTPAPTLTLTQQDVQSIPQPLTGVTISSFGESTNSGVIDQARRDGDVTDQAIQEGYAVKSSESLSEISDCNNRNHLAWLQSGIRSAAEIADMGRGGASTADVFKGCY